MGGSGPELRRVVSRWEITALALTGVIGSGVYLLPAAATALLGPFSLWAVLLAGFAVLLIALCFAEAATYFDEPGGAYLYAKAAFGDLAGFEVGWMTWLARVATLGSLSAGFAQALTYLIPSVAGGWARAAAIALPVLGLTALNVLSVRSGVNASTVLLILKLLPLLLFTGGGLLAMAHHPWESQSEGEGAIGQAALLLVFAYGGFENTAAAAGEFRNPRRDVPFALIFTITVVTVLYMLVQWIALATVADLAASATPLADAAGAHLGAWAGWVLTIGAAIAILGTAGGTVLAAPRYLYALARDGFLPPLLGSVHPRFRTPAFSIVVLSALALPLALSGGFAGLAELSVIARLVTYMGTAAAVPFLRARRGRGAGGFRIPFGAAIPVVAVLLSLTFAAGAKTSNLIAAAAAGSVGLLLFAIRSRWQKDKAVA